MLIQSTVGRLPRLLQQAQLFIVALQGFLKWADQRIDSLLPLHQITLCFDVKAFKRHGGEFQECLVILLQRFAGQSLE